MAETDGEHKIKVREPHLYIHVPDKALTVQTGAFYKLWEAGCRSTSYLYTHPYKKAPLDHELVVHANFAGQLVQFAQVLVSDPSLILGPGGPAYEFEAVAKSAKALKELLWGSWLSNLRPLPNTDEETWDLFLEIVQIFQRGDDPNDKLDSFAAKAGLSIEAADLRAAFYAKHVFPEWRRWFTGLGSNVPLPRI